ncbi:hypothetical protein AX16_008057 [Volvariella volvacea WC 439]|nr:hypothetical protein AX16_008057 [Volvariella volvacea WC 439]
MLAFARQATVPRIISRTFAQVVNTTSGVSSAKPSAPVNGLPLTGRIPVKKDHGLYAFFRRKQGEGLVGDARFETLESPESMQKLPSGRAWRASELRLKSFKDLHVLWYVLLRERNLLATQKEEARRLGVTNSDLQVSATRVHNCRKSMARIKAVINERRVAYEGAIKLIEAEEDEAVLEEQTRIFKRERSTVLRRRATTRRLREKQKRVQAQAEQEQANASSVATSEPVTENRSEEKAKATQSESEHTSKATPETAPEPELAQPSNAPRPSPVHTATAGLFGADGNRS